MYPIQIKNKNKKLYIERTFTKKVHNLAKLFFFSIILGLSMGQVYAQLETDTPELGGKKGTHHRPAEVIGLGSLEHQRVVGGLVGFKTERKR